jgi:hypothetical protein
VELGTSSPGNYLNSVPGKIWRSLDRDWNNLGDLACRDESDDYVGHGVYTLMRQSFWDRDSAGLSPMATAIAADAITRSLRA